MWWLVRKWWTESDPSVLLHSENRLLSSLVKHPFRKPDEILADDKHGGLNLVEFRARHAEETKPGCSASSSLPTVVMAHGFGSGLSFFYRNIDDILNSGKVKRVILVDWLGMGGSTRLPSSKSPIRSILSRFTSRSDVFPHLNFFLDPFDSLLRDKNMFDPNEPIWLVGHSLGGYLAAKYVMRIHEEQSTSEGLKPNITKLILASPVGFQPLPAPHEIVSLPFPLRIFKALWAANFTPQAIVRMMGSSRGKRAVKNVLHRRIPHLNSNSVTDDGVSELDLLSEYFYHITVAPPSGEYAMNSLLEPSASSSGIGIFALESLGCSSLADAISANRPSSLESIKVLFGDNDWMKFHEPMARLEMQEILSRCSIPSSVQIIPNAGHHLYIDNPDNFVRQILDD